MWIVYLSLLIILELVADIFAKQWSLDARLFWAVGALVAYLVANIFWLFSLSYGAGLARGGVIFSVASAVAIFLLGFLWYDEPLAPLQIIGALVGIIALVLMFL